jgi:hypothetical protein
MFWYCESINNKNISSSSTLSFPPRKFQAHSVCIDEMVISKLTLTVIMYKNVSEQVLPSEPVATNENCLLSHSTRNIETLGVDI